MKKVALFLGVAFVASLALTSCKGDYTCECTNTLAGQSQTFSIEYKDVKKSDAQESCDALDLLYTGGCELK